MSNFAKHNLNHTSASQVNMYSNCAAAWCARYLYGRQFTFGNAPRAGILVEDAVVAVLTDTMSIDEAVEKTTDTYKSIICLTGTPSDVKRGEAIEGMIRGAVDVLTPYGEPSFDYDENGKIRQKGIELLCKGDGWELPIIGYLDLVYPDHNLVIDLKTTMRSPSAMSIEHKRQGAIYQKATGMDVKFLYVTGKKKIMHDVCDVDDTLAEIKMILNRQEKLLGLDADLIKDIVPCNKGSFYWSDDLAMARELYNI